MHRLPDDCNVAWWRSRNAYEHRENREASMANTRSFFMLLAMFTMLAERCFSMRLLPMVDPLPSRTFVHNDNVRDQSASEATLSPDEAVEAVEEAFDFDEERLHQIVLPQVPTTFGLKKRAERRGLRRALWRMRRWVSESTREYLLSSIRPLTSNSPGPISLTGEQNLDLEEDKPSSFANTQMRMNGFTAKDIYGNRLEKHIINAILDLKQSLLREKSKTHLHGRGGHQVGYVEDDTFGKHGIFQAIGTLKLRGGAFRSTGSGAELTKKKLRTMLSRKRKEQHSFSTSATSASTSRNREAREIKAFDTQTSDVRGSQIKNRLTGTALYTNYEPEQSQTLNAANIKPSERISDPNELLQAQESINPSNVNNCNGHGNLTSLQKYTGLTLHNQMSSDTYPYFHKLNSGYESENKTQTEKMSSCDTEHCEQKVMEPSETVTFTTPITLVVPLLDVKDNNKGHGKTQTMSVVVWDKDKELGLTSARAELPNESVKCSKGYEPRTFSAENTRCHQIQNEGSLHSDDVKMRPEQVSTNSEMKMVSKGLELSPGDKKDSILDCTNLEMKNNQNIDHTNSEPQDINHYGSKQITPIRVVTGNGEAISNKNATLINLKQHLPCGSLTCVPCLCSSRNRSAGERCSPERCGLRPCETSTHCGPGPCGKKPSRQTASASTLVIPLNEIKHTSGVASPYHVSVFVWNDKGEPLKLTKIPLIPMNKGQIELAEGAFNHRLHTSAPLSEHMINKKTRNKERNLDDETGWSTRFPREEVSVMDEGICSPFTSMDHVCRLWGAEVNSTQELDEEDEDLERLPIFYLSSPFTTESVETTINVELPAPIRRRRLVPFISNSTVFLDDELPNYSAGPNRWKRFLGFGSKRTPVTEEDEDMDNPSTGLSDSTIYPSF